MAIEMIDRLEQLGFKSASGNLKKVAEKKRKMAIAYEHYRFVRPEKIAAFNEKLKKKTMRKENYNTKFQQLSFTPVEAYEKVPPADVLDGLETAIGRKCFDKFEVAHIVEVTEDPILFGRITGCPDRFFIAQWDNDVKIEDILTEKEG